MQVHITVPAALDLQEIEEFISRSDARAAGRLIQNLGELCMVLGRHPKIGRRREYIVPGLRTISEGNYIICYRVEKTSIEIVRVLHGAQNINEILRPDTD